jgi:hypothetical protein
MPILAHVPQIRRGAPSPPDTPHSAVQSARMHLLALLGRAGGPADFDLPARRAGGRAPLASTFTGLERSCCLPPFPSSTFIVADTTTDTGVRVAIEPEALTERVFALGLKHIVRTPSTKRTVRGRARRSAYLSAFRQRSPAKCRSVQ